MNNNSFSEIRIIEVMFFFLKTVLTFSANNQTATFNLREISMDLSVGEKLKLHSTQKVVVLPILNQQSFSFSIFDLGYCGDRSYFDCHWYIFCETTSDELQVYQELDFEIERGRESVCVYARERERDRDV